MKKFTVAIIALALVMSLSVPAFAANQTSAQTELSFTYVPVEPSYTVTIPGSLPLVFGDNYLPITVSDTGNLSGRAVTVTFEGTQHQSDSHYWMYLRPDVPGDSPHYELYNADDVQILSTAANPSGHILAQFTVDGIKQIKILFSYNEIKYMEPGVTYTGQLIFGIKLV